MRAANGDVLMVGSLPFDTVEEAFRSVGSGLGRHAAGYPDGEVGDRSTWVGFLIGAVFVGHPQLVSSRPGWRGELRQPGSDEERESFQEEGPPTFTVAPGETVRFDDLRYGTIAVESYRVLERLRAEGAVPADVRFQVSLPAPNSAIIGFFSDPDQWPALFAAYAERLRDEIALVVDAIPPSELLIQFDLAWEVVDLSTADENYLPFWPASTFAEKWERHTERLGELAAMVPAEAQVGYHWCYGTWGGWPMTAMQDLGLCVALSNEAVRQADRRVDYVHMPVTKHPDKAFFAPLADLDVGDTDVYLGIVHHTDGMEGFRERAALARDVLPEFGVSSVCGYGRIDPAELPHVLAVHRDCANHLSA